MPPKNTLESKSVNTLIGYFILFLMLSLFMGGPMQVLGMLLVLVICTGGVGGLLIVAAIPVAYGLGTVFMLVFIDSWHNREGKEISNKEQQVTHEEIAVLEYIQKGRKSGLSDKDILSKLQSAGWNEKIISLALSHANISS